MFERRHLADLRARRADLRVPSRRSKARRSVSSRSAYMEARSMTGKITDLLQEHGGQWRRPKSDWHRKRGGSKRPPRTACSRWFLGRCHGERTFSRRWHAAGTTWSTKAQSTPADWPEPRTRQAPCYTDSHEQLSQSDCHVPQSPTDQGRQIQRRHVRRRTKAVFLGLVCARLAIAAGEAYKLWIIQPSLAPIRLRIHQAIASRICRIDQNGS